METAQGFALPIPDETNWLRVVWWGPLALLAIDPAERNGRQYLTLNIYGVYIYYS